MGSSKIRTKAAFASVSIKWPDGMNWDIVRINRSAKANLSLKGEVKVGSFLPFEVRINEMQVTGRASVQYCQEGNPVFQ